MFDGLAVFVQPALVGRQDLHGMDLRGAERNLQIFQMRTVH
jgi:hypothetical protein